MFLACLAKNDATRLHEPHGWHASRSKSTGSHGALLQPTAAHTKRLTQKDKQRIPDTTLRMSALNFGTNFSNKNALNPARSTILQHSPRDLSSRVGNVKKLFQLGIDHVEALLKCLNSAVVLENFELNQQPLNVANVR